MNELLAEVIGDIALERARQIAKGYTTDHDARHGAEELERVAVYLISPGAGSPNEWAGHIKGKWYGNRYRLTIIAATFLVAAAELRRQSGEARSAK
jgi:hypothetical protein